AKAIVAREVSITAEEVDALWRHFSFLPDSESLIPFFKEVDAWTAERDKQTPRTASELESMLDDSVLESGKSNADQCHIKS
ncbi:MAG: hypothetical protein MN733_37700, partial [Nitrososphaera sp.]|nr:hypothetical protein [Nitrososphaera sp.]